MSDIHKIAADFLADLELGDSIYREEQIEVEPLATATIVELVALRRSAPPCYFYGFKSSGRPLFTHDLRLAKSFDAKNPELMHHVRRLELIGEAVVPHPTVWFEGKHRNGHKF
jgi:hypothetical protein